jgi:hypothetical protein
MSQLTMANASHSSLSMSATYKHTCSALSMTRPLLIGGGSDPRESGNICLCKPQFDFSITCLNQNQELILHFKFHREGN